MIYLHKLLPLFLSPIVIVILLIVYGAIRKRKAPALVAAFILYLASMPFVSDSLFRVVEAGAVRQDPKSAPNADAIVVLSGMLSDVESDEGVIPEWGDPDRFFGGLELCRSGKSKKLVFTGGLLPWQTHRVPEGAVLRKHAEAMGVPQKDIFVSGEANNTEQEATAVRALLSGESPSILLVTSAFHMPRARLLFERAGFRVHGYPVDFKVSVRQTTSMDFAPDARSLWLTDLAIRELVGRLHYRVKDALS